MKRRLLIFHPIIAPYRIDLFNALADQYESKIVLFWRNLKDQTFNYTKIEEQFNFTPTYLVKNELGSWRWIKSIWHILNSEKPDTVVVNEYGICTILTLIHRFFTRQNDKIVCITDDSYNMLEHNNHFSRRHKYAIRFLAPFIDEFINVEPKSAQWYQTYYHKGVYFPIIVDDRKSVARYSNLLPLSEDIIKEYDLEGTKVLLFVGRLVQLKNVQLAISAIRSINNKDIRFVIVGSGSFEHSLKSLAEGDDRIIFVGRKEGDELYAWYNIAQLFVLPSYQEPFGAVTNEALLGGCRCLVSQHAGSQCLIEEGVNGCVFNPFQETELKNILIREVNKAKPITLPLLGRESLMIFNFEEMTNKLFKEL